MTTTTTVVLGGTGKTGRRVVERLRMAGVPVRVGSRSGQPRFDWNDPATWPPVLRGPTRPIWPTTRTWRCPAPSG